MSFFGDIVSTATGMGPLGTILNAGKSVVGGLQNQYHADPLQLQDEEARKQRFAQAIQQNQANAGQMQQGQNALVGQLQNASVGQGPSMARQLLGQAQDQNLAQANAQAASARGDVNPAMLMRQSQMNMANNNQALAQQAGVMGAQEQLNARQQLGQQLAETRGQDQNMSQFYENNNLAANKDNLDAAMNAQNLNAGVASSNSAGNRQLIGGVMSGLSSAGAAAAASDENLKKDVKDGSGDMYKFLDAIKAHSYKYKQPEMDGQGQQHSVMAQELEKTPVGKAMVQDTPRGKMVDYGKGFGAILAAQAELHSRLKGLEKGKK